MASTARGRASRTGRRGVLPLGTAEMTDRAYKILGCCAGALILTVMTSQFHLSWNDAFLLFLAFAAICYFAID
jgi:hypothetical protein